MQHKYLFKSRIKWFGLKTKEFINRYLMGIVVLVIFLPGVGVGENFNLLISFVTKPFALISQPDVSFFIKQISLYLLIAIFVVWSRAQRSAISGGEFALFQNSLPIHESDKKRMNVKMLLLGNHFLWPFIVVSYFYLSADSEQYLITAFHNTFLILLLLSIQYLSVFNTSYKKVGLLIGLGMVFTLQLDLPYNIYKIVLVFLLWFVFVWRDLFSENVDLMPRFKIGLLTPSFLSNNFYFQILFKSGLTSSLFRIIVVVLLMFGFTLVINNWVDDLNDLLPYYLVLEAILAYFMSGFYVSFFDQRNSMKPWFDSLPIKKHFWVFRDLLVVLILTVALHGCFYIWAISLSSIAKYQTLLIALVYHLLLLIVCYPIRLFVIKKQTFITFVTLFIITAITLYNLS